MKERFQAIITKRKDNMLNEYKENALLTDEIVEQIADEHSIEVKKVYKNVYVKFNNKSVEFDVLIKAETPTGRTRWISIELKESDISKVINQAIVRRDFVDYSYVIINFCVKWVTQYIFYVCSDDIKEYNIGFFARDVFVLNSKYKKSKIKIKDEN